MKITHILTFITIIFLVTACEHKELCFAHAHTTEMQVIFNWKYAPEAHPASMRLYLFPETGKEPLIYEFGNHMEGKITVSVGRYRALCMNNDTEFILFRNTDHYESIKAYLADGAFPRPVPRAGNTGEQRVKLRLTKAVERPHGRSGSSSFGKGTDVDAVSESHSMPLHGGNQECRKPEIPHRGRTVRLAYQYVGRLYAGNKPADRGTGYSTVRHDIRQQVDCKRRLLHFRLSGHIDQHSVSYCVHAILNDGKKYSFTYDVTEKIHNSPDPANVHILLDGLPSPNP